MSELAEMKFTHPAGIITRSMSMEELLTLAKNRAPDPDAFNEYPPLFISAESTNNRLDSYFTRMSVSSLKNYALEAGEGVSFQDSHQTDALSFMMGRSLTGEFKGVRATALRASLLTFTPSRIFPRQTASFRNTGPASRAMYQ